jgi:NADPH:quinone reductase-like Zn-dependent oxidoreductase
MKTMKAMRIRRFGGPEAVVVEDIPVPRPKAGEALIRVEAAGVNPIDWKLREGMNKDLPLPFTLGVDFCGVIVELGPSSNKAGGALALRPNDEVYGAGGSGADAEFLVAPLSHIARKPGTLSTVEAASVPVVGLTAWQGLFTHGELRSGQTVLILGASGGVGRFAVQLAASAGAKVYGTASGESIELLRKLGCERPIDYKNERIEDIVKDADLCLDLVGGELQERALSVVKRGGRLISTVEQPAEDLAAAGGILAKFFVMQPDASQLRELATRIDAGKLSVEVAKVLPLKKAAEGEELNRRHEVQGKIVLTV